MSNNREKTRKVVLKSAHWHRRVKHPKGAELELRESQVERLKRMDKIEGKARDSSKEEGDDK